MEYQIWSYGLWFDLWPWLTLLNSTRINFFTHSDNTTRNLSAVVRVQQRGKAPEKELLLDPACMSNTATPCIWATKTQPKSHRSGQLGMLGWQQHLGRYILLGYPCPRARTTWHISQQLCKLSDLFFSKQPSQVLKLNTTVVVYTWHLPSASSALAHVRNFMNWLLSESIHNRWRRAGVRWLPALPARRARQLPSALPWAVGSAGCLCFIPRD